MKDVRAIAAILHPNLDLSERTLSTKQIALVINAIRSESITPEEHALGSFAAETQAPLHMAKVA